MEFEYDPEKSELNLKKHGVSLEEAKALWLVPGVVIQARSIDEPRFLRIAELEGKHYSCFFTVREMRIRLISARRSRPEEIAIYEGEMKRNEEKEKGFYESGGSRPSV